MIPVVAIVGSPNTGKSTLFNRLTASRRALVADYAGVTRDRLYAVATLRNRDYLLIDTGGFSEQNKDMLTEQIHQQIALAIEEADLCLLVVDSSKPPSGDDLQLLDTIRKKNVRWITLLNKSDKGSDSGHSEFYRYYPEFLPVSASHNRGFDKLYRALEASLPAAQPKATEDDTSIRLAVLGRPNVGKSTLINRIIGEQRVMALDLPGTTRDLVDIPFEWQQHQLRLIDTPGIRRRSKVHHFLEKFSVLKSLQAAQDCHVAILMIDTRDGLVEQDLRLIETISKTAPAVVFAVNKSDIDDRDQQDKTERDLDRRYQVFLGQQPLAISALFGRGIDQLLGAVVDCYQKSHRQIPTSLVNSVLHKATEANPPAVRGRTRPRLKFAHQQGNNPQSFIIHGNQTGKLNQSYVTYLYRQFRQQLALEGICFRLLFRDSDNPYTAAKKP